jgi:hypothetical protein
LKDEYLNRLNNLALILGLGYAMRYMLSKYDVLPEMFMNPTEKWEKAVKNIRYLFK